VSNSTLGLSEALHAYLLEVGVREPDVLKRLRAETEALPQHSMQIAPEQGAFMTLLVGLIGARRCIEVGTFTGYSSTCIASALPQDGLLVCCDVSTEWTDVAQRYWAEAGVADRIDLRIAPAVETLDAMIAAGESETYDFAFIDADKGGYAAYYERLLQLVRPGGLLALDNVLWGGDVADPAVDDDNTRAIRAINATIAADERVSPVMLPLADGVTLARKR
jgi:predicted O-methyltransferase YrrM